MSEIINKVAKSGLMSLDIKDYYPQLDIVSIDLKDQLFQGFVLREKDFRAWCKECDWQKFEGKLVALHCTADAIIPVWAYMLVTQHLEGIAQSITFGNQSETERKLVSEHFQNLDVLEFQDQRVIIKGCSEINEPETAFLSFTACLKPVVKSLMFGEACSSVPIYKKSK